MSIRLAVLGLLMEGESHPYELRQEMKEREMQHYMNMREGSLYYAMDRLRKEGAVEVVGVVRDNHRPDKTVYAITEKGRKLFHEMLLEKFRENGHMSNPLYAALAFAARGDQRRIAETIAERIGELEKLAERLQAVYREHVGYVPRSALYLMRGCYEHARIELDLLKRVYRDAKAGRLNEFGPPLEAES